MVDTQKHKSLSFQNTFKLGFKTDYTPSNNVFVKYNRLRGKRAVLLPTGCLRRAGLLAGICRTKVKVRGGGAVVTIF